MIQNRSSTPSKYSAIEIAKYFISKARSEDKPLTNKKIQKLLYYSQAWSVTILNKKLFEDKIEAWVHGPAIRSIYNIFSQFGADDFSKVFDIADFKTDVIDSDERDILDSIWKVYGKREANYLEILSHSEDPWKEARKGLEPNQPSNNEITTQSMRRYYGQKIEKKQ